MLDQLGIWQDSSDKDLKNKENILNLSIQSKISKSIYLRLLLGTKNSLIFATAKGLQRVPKTHVYSL